MNPEAAFFASLLNGSHSPADLRLVQAEHFTADWLPVHAYVMQFVRDQGKLPRLETVEGACHVQLPPAREHVAFYAQAVLDNALRFKLDVSLTEEVAAPLAQADPHTAVAGLNKVAGDIRRAFPTARPGLVMPDVRDGVRKRLSAYHIRAKAAQTNSPLGLPLPWPSITRATQGFWGIWYLLARPGMGKTWITLLVAVFLWQLGYNVFLVSMETAPEADLPKDRRHRVVQGWCRFCYEHGVSPAQECPAAGVNRQLLSVRIDAIAARISPWRFLNGCLTPFEYQRLVRYYTYMEQGAPAWGRLKVVASPFVSTLDDYEAECRAFDGDAGFIDSGYRMLRGIDPRNLDKTSNRASELVMAHKDVHERLAIPGWMSWHFNATVSEDATKANASGTIMHTDEVNRASDVMLGVFRPPDLQMAGEAIGRTLKVREGLALREMRMFFRVKEDLNFAEISAGAPGGRGGKDE